MTGMNEATGNEERTLEAVIASYAANYYKSDSERETTWREVGVALAEHDRQMRAEVLQDAADEMEAVIADGNVAEVAAPVVGETGRYAAIDRRDALHEEPHKWLRAWAER